MTDGLEKLKELETKEADAETVAKAAKETTKEETTIEPQIDDLGRSYATGRRKTSTARVWLKRGSGKITVNGKDIENFFVRPTQRMLINQPFEKTEREGQYDIICTVSGGGLSGQAGAVRHGVSQALYRFEPDLRPTLKKAGFLTRDSRMVERKKYGRRKARRSRQWNKR